ncbi:hypothetical protein [Streptacidiphilus monticola]|uniref:Small CPxCG-related zinc finger protein n=1 Tax=Streptacidiphilus monticola TaxID=2161674 RepID=A0ABW1G7F9_9ACTN
MTSRNPKKTPAPVPPSGTPLKSADGREMDCELCGQPRPVLFQTTPDTHEIEQAGEIVPARVCLRCWSKHHREALVICPHCGNEVEDALW